MDNYRREHTMSCANFPVNSIFQVQIHSAFALFSTQPSLDLLAILGQDPGSHTPPYWTRSSVHRKLANTTSRIHGGTFLNKGFQRHHSAIDLTMPFEFSEGYRPQNYAFRYPRSALCPNAV